MDTVGGVVSALTVNIAVPLEMLPAGLVTLTTKLAPLSDVLVAGVV